MFRCSAILCLIALAAGLPLAAAGAGPKPPAKPPAHAKYNANGEMERPDATPAAWSAQAAQVQKSTTAAPCFTGCYVWGGRADREYKPFHQWELRLAAGTEAIAGLKLRLSALDPKLQFMDGKTGHWVELGDLKPGESRDLSYKLNTPTPMAIQVDLAWTGGEEKYLATDKASLPQPKGDVADRPLLNVLEPMFNHVAKLSKGEVGFFLRNDGGADAHGTVCAISLLDANGKVVKTHDHIPGVKGLVKKGYAEFQQVIIANCPKFSTVSIKTRCDEDQQANVDPGRFTTAAELEYAELAVKDGILSLKARNGTKGGVTGLTITVTLHDKDGKVLATVPVAVGDLKPGEIKAASAKTTAKTFAGYTVAFDTGGGTGAKAAPAAAPSTKPQVTADDLVLTIESTAPKDGGLAVVASVFNNSKGLLPGLTVTLDLAGEGGAAAKQEIAVGDLGALKTHKAEFTVPLTAITGLGLSYTLKKTVVTPAEP